MRSSRRTAALAVVFVLCSAVLFQTSDTGHFLGQMIISRQGPSRNVSRDDSGSTFRTSVGEWERKFGHGQRGGYMINENPEEYHWAYLEFPNVPAGSYDVYVTWPKEAVNHLRGTLQMDEQLYKKIGNSGWEYVSEERVDLKNPREDAKVRERVWTKIGSVSLESKGSIAVRVWDGSVLIEDAAWIVPSGTGIEAVCGNDVCEEDEDDVSCAADCTPECGDGKEEGTESCDEGASNGQACTPECGESCTYCSETCTVETVEGPVCAVCGNGSEEGEEECDEGDQNGKECTTGYGQTCEFCSSECESVTVTGSNCGDGATDRTDGEECDQGSQNGQACTAGYGQSCQYCSSSCTAVTVTGPRCGDSTTDTGNGEQCDNGSQNGQACTAGYGQTCEYCSSQCTAVRVTGPRCGDGTTDAGNGEQCDDGEINGQACTAQCDGSCTYCSANCTTETVAGSPCSEPSLEIVEPSADISIVSTEEYALRFTAPENPNTRYSNTLDQFHFEVSMDGGPWNEITTGSMTAYLNNDGEYEIHYTYFETFAECLANNDRCSTNNSFPTIKVAFCNHGPQQCNGDFIPRVYLPVLQSDQTLRFRITDAEDSSLTDVSPVISFRELAEACGNGMREGAEECDQGSQNGQACTAGYGQTCQYCSSQCTSVTVTGPSCGDSTTDTGNGEQCDDGSQNGQVCTAEYGQTCEYCSTQCTPVTVTGPRCGDGTVDTDREECDDGGTAPGDGCSETCTNEHAAACEVTSLPAPTYTAWIASGDLDGDGDTDLATLGNILPGQGGTTISVFLSNGDGTFETHKDYTPGGVYRDVALGDFDKDGDKDIVLGINSFDRQIAIVANNGQGKFNGTPRTFSTGGGHFYHEVSVGDVNGDGDLDVFAGGLYDGGTIFIGGAGLNFSAGPELGTEGGNQYHPTLVDVDNDGDLDAIATPHGAGGTNMQVFRNNGQGVFGAPTSYSHTPMNPYTNDLLTGDVNGDSFVDFVQLPNGGGFYVWMNDTHGAFTKTVHSENLGRDGALADFTGDGVRDLIGCVYVSANYNFRRGNGNGTFADTVTLPMQTTGRSMVTADFDGDGRIDLAQAMAESEDAVRIILNVGQCVGGGGTGGPVCGNGGREGTEECDNGSQNGQVCIALYGQSCQYCASDCTTVTVTGPRCGDSTTDTGNGEQCDNGSQNGQACTAGYGQTCEYCSSQCSTVTVTGPHCGDGTVDTGNGETCDDGGTASGDGCSAQCTTESSSMTLNFTFVDRSLNAAPVPGVHDYRNNQLNSDANGRLSLEGNPDGDAWILEKGCYGYYGTQVQQGYAGKSKALVLRPFDAPEQTFEIAGMSNVDVTTLAGPQGMYPFAQFRLQSDQPVTFSLKYNHKNTAGGGSITQSTPKTSYQFHPGIPRGYEAYDVQVQGTGGRNIECPPYTPVMQHETGTCGQAILTVRNGSCFWNECGNGICEEGEADFFDPGGCGPSAPPECLGPPAQLIRGTCTSDCQSPQDLCGNGRADQGEQCDNGSQNGQACTAACGQTCSYCSSQCTTQTVQGSACRTGGGGEGRPDTGDLIVVDDGDSTFQSTINNWQTKTGKGFNGDYISLPDLRSGNATYTFNNLMEGTYKVYATWPARHRAIANFFLHQSNQGGGELYSKNSRTNMDLSRNPNGSYTTGNLAWEELFTTTCDWPCNIVLYVAGKGPLDFDAIGVLPGSGGGANHLSAPACGNGVINAGEQCDSGTANGRECTPAYGQECRYCGGNCMWLIKEGPRCGDGNTNRDHMEECDDRNRTNGDGCSAECRNEVQTTGSCDFQCQEQNVLDYFSYDGVMTVRSVVINAHYVFADIRNKTTHPFTDITEDGKTNQNDIAAITQAMLKLSKPGSNGIDIWKTYLSLDSNRDYQISTEEINAADLAYQAWLRGERQSRPSQEMLDIYEEMLYLVRYLSQH